MNGQAKLDFEKWLEDKYNLDSIEWNDFNTTCRNALKIEWFDSVNIIVYNYCIKDNFQTIWSYSIKGKYESQFKFKTRQEATEKAIEKAVEIYNNLK